MSIVTDTWRQLVRRRLWPVAVLLVAALAAVPLLLAKDPEPARRGRRAGRRRARARACWPPSRSCPSPTPRTSGKRRRVLGVRHDIFKPTAKAPKGQGRSDTGRHVGSARPRVHRPGRPARAPRHDRLRRRLRPPAPRTPTPVRARRRAGEDLAGQLAHGALRRRRAGELARRHAQARCAPLPVRGGAGGSSTSASSDDGKTAVFLLVAGVQPTGDGDLPPATDGAARRSRSRPARRSSSTSSTPRASITAQYQLDVRRGPQPDERRAPPRPRARPARPRAALGLALAVTGRPASAARARRRRPAGRRMAPRRGASDTLSGVSLRVVTAGESHGPGLTCVVEGLPAGLELDREAINRDMARRQLGHGRGGRMKIERDSAEVTSGVRHGRTLGGPIALQVANRDYANWEERMNPWPVEADVPEVHLPRPGPRRPGRRVEVRLHRRPQRAGARQRARDRGPRGRRGARQGASCGRSASRSSPTSPRSAPCAPRSATTSRSADFAAVDESPVRCLDPEATRAMVEEINVLRKRNESLGGVFELRAFGLVPGPRLARLLGGAAGRPHRHGAAVHPGAQGRRPRGRLRPRRARPAPAPTTRSSTTRSAATTARRTTRAAWRAA